MLCVIVGKGCIVKRFEQGEVAGRAFVVLGRVGLISVWWVGFNIGQVLKAEGGGYLYLPCVRMYSYLAGGLRFVETARTGTLYPELPVFEDRVRQHGSFIWR